MIGTPPSNNGDDTDAVCSTVQTFSNPGRRVCLRLSPQLMEPALGWSPTPAADAYSRPPFPGRVGWVQPKRESQLQAYPGFDEWGYGYRDKEGVPAFRGLGWELETGNCLKMQNCMSQLHLLVLDLDVNYNFMAAVGSPSQK